MDANGRGALSRGGIVFHSLCLAKTAQQTSVIYQFLFLVCLEQLKSKQFIVCRLKVITIIRSKTHCTNLISICSPYPNTNVHKHSYELWNQQEIMSSYIKLTLSTHFLVDSIQSLSGSRLFLELVLSVIKEGGGKRSWTGATPLFYRFCTVCQEIFESPSDQCLWSVGMGGRTQQTSGKWLGIKPRTFFALRSLIPPL